MRKDILNWKHKKGDEIWVPFLELFKSAPVSDEEFTYLVVNSSENMNRHEKSNYNPVRKCLNSIYYKDKFTEQDLTEIDNNFLSGERVNRIKFLERLEKYPMSQKTFNSLVKSPNTTGDYDKYKQNFIKRSEMIMDIANKLHRQSNHKTRYFSSEQVEDDLEEQIKNSKKDNPSVRKNRLKEAPKIPEQIQILSVGFKRNPDVITEVLLRANGLCERCNINAPFTRKKDNTPYLEVHHKTTLSNGGEDTIENAIAICPNCHRELHFGV